MANITRTIIVRTIFENTGFNQFLRQIREPIRATSGLTNMANRLGISTQELTKNFKAQGISMKGAALAGSGMLGVLGRTLPVVGAIASGAFRIAKGIYNFGKRLARFRPEWLSVLFISMMFSQTLKGMIQQVLKVTGVFEIWRALLIAILLPVLMPLIKIFLKIAKWFMNLPEPVKKLIGTLVLLAATFFSILFVLSQFIIMFSSLGIGLGTIMVLLGPFTAALVGVGLAVHMFGNEVEGITDKLSDMITRGVEKAKEFIIRFGDEFIANRDKIFSIANTIMTTIFDGILEILDALGPYVIAFIDTLKELFDANKERMKLIAKWIIDKIVYFAITFLPDIMELGISLLDSLLEALRENRDKIREAVDKMVIMLYDVFSEEGVVSKLISVGIDIAKAIIVGMTKEFARRVSSSFIESNADTWFGKQMGWGGGAEEVGVYAEVE